MSFNLWFVHTLEPNAGGSGRRLAPQISPCVRARNTFCWKASVVGGRHANFGAFDSFPRARFFHTLHLKKLMIYFKNSYTTLSSTWFPWLTFREMPRQVVFPLIFIPSHPVVRRNSDHPLVVKKKRLIDSIKIMES